MLAVAFALRVRHAVEKLIHAMEILLPQAKPKGQRGIGIQRGVLPFGPLRRRVFATLVDDIVDVATCGGGGAKRDRRYEAKQKRDRHVNKRVLVESRNAEAPNMLELKGSGQ